MGFLFHNEASCVVDVIQSSHQQLHHHCRRRRHCRCRHHLTSRRVRTDVAVASSRVKPQSSQVDAGRRSRADRLFFFLLFFRFPVCESSAEQQREKHRKGKETAAAQDEEIKLLDIFFSFLNSVHCFTCSRLRASLLPVPLLCVCAFNTFLHAEGERVVAFWCVFVSLFVGFSLSSCVRLCVRFCA